MAGRERANPERTPPGRPGGGRIFTLEVALIRGPTAEEFDRANPVVSRTLAMRGDQTLADFHWAIFDAFDRDDEQPYEFQFGVAPMDPRARCYGTAGDAGLALDPGGGAAGGADHARLDDVGLMVGRAFFYWFDFGDDWWHRVRVLAVEPAPSEGEYPRVVARVGASPPQRPRDEDAAWVEDDPENEGDADLGDMDLADLEALVDEGLLLEEAEALGREFPELFTEDVLGLLDENLLEEADELLRRRLPEPFDDENGDEEQDEDGSLGRGSS